MLIHSLKLTNFLSFGPDSERIELGPLNVLIGPNGSGKSNLIEAVGLLQAAPRDLSVPIRKGGGVREWLWKGHADGAPTASLVAVIGYPKGPVPLLYRLSFSEKGQRFALSNERIQESTSWDGNEPYRYFGYENGQPKISIRGKTRRLRSEHLHPEQSILSQRKDPDQYPALTHLGEVFSAIRIYREWSFGRFTPARLPQNTDLPNDLLEENAGNLGLVLNRLRREPAVKRRVLEGLQELYEGIDDFDVRIEGGTVQVFVQEGEVTIPGTRLSDGTLRYLCLLTVLCHPHPPSLVCIEEPELGLHPDILPTIAGLLREASKQTQLIVTTHSDVLVDALTDTPEAVVVCEKRDGASSMRRLDRGDLSAWLEKYSLGQLWTRGDIGGTRW